MILNIFSFALCAAITHIDTAISFDIFAASRFSPPAR